MIPDRNDVEGNGLVGVGEDAPPPRPTSHETAAVALLDRWLGRWARDPSTAELLRGRRLAGDLVGLEPLQTSDAFLSRALPHT